MTSGVRGDFAKINDFKAGLRDLPTSLAFDVAQRAAPEMTGLTKSAYDGGRSVYGEPRPTGANGQALDLHVTGDTARQLRFVANGTVVRCVLGPKYAKYLIGKYSILPNGALPAEWSAALSALVAQAKPELP